MADVLMVCRDVNLHRADALHEDRPQPIYTVSVDEKPGVQVLGTVAADLPPVAGKHSSVGRDYEYVRHGTLSIIAALDLHTGEIIAHVEPRHRSREFIVLLKRLDAHYPDGATIRIVLDNHSAHISKETMAYLSSRPGRFTYVHTPKHGSWLNLVEGAFSKMARSFLRHIRVASTDPAEHRRDECTARALSVEELRLPNGMIVNILMKRSVLVRLSPKTTIGGVTEGNASTIRGVSWRQPDKHGTIY